MNYGREQNEDAGEVVKKPRRSNGERKARAPRSGEEK